MTDSAPNNETPSGASSDASVADAPSGESSATELDTLEALRRERDALQERLLRLAADFDNYRKRVDRERRDQADAAMIGALQDLLPLIDDMERALDAPEDSHADLYRKGVELIHRQMTELLRRRGVTPIEAAGTDFDPRVHQAVMHEPSPDHRDGEVIEELRRGYMLGDRLLRPAMVKVAKA
jgi:molecular chaperone GrpE